MNVLMVSSFGFIPHLRSFQDAVLARALVGQGHCVEAVTGRLPGDSAFEVVGGTPVHRLRSLRSLFPALAAKVLRQRWDIVHIFHQRNGLAPWVTLLARARGVPVVFSEWGLLHSPFLSRDRDHPLDAPPTYERVVPSLGAGLRSVRAGSHSWRSALQSWWFHIPHYRADSLLFFSAHNLPLAEGLGLTSRQVAWMPAFVDDALYSPPLSAPDCLPPFQHPLILFVGQLKLRKGFDLLVRAAPLVLQHMPTAQFVILSTNSQEHPLLDRLIAEHAPDGRFTVLFRVSNTTKDWLLSQADVLVIPSRYEGFGIPVLEAFAAGCPVVASDVVALNEVLRHGENGWLVPAQDPTALARGMLEVLGTPHLKNRLREGAQASLPHYRVERHLPAVMALYEGLMAASGRGSRGTRRAS
jgi:glycosyltransferase involved in cell wall biosynthesis